MTEPLHISAEKTMDALHSILLEKGADYSDPNWEGGCRYFESSGRPSCLVGHVFARLGMAPFSPDPDEPHPDNDAVVSDLVANGRIVFDDAPRYQDSPTYKLRNEDHEAALAMEANAALAVKGMASFRPPRKPEFEGRP